MAIVSIMKAWPGTDKNCGFCLYILLDGILKTDYFSAFFNVAYEILVFFRYH